MRHKCTECGRPCGCADYTPEDGCMTCGCTSKTRCAATVYVRDTYRRTGRNKSRFAMHYVERQCKRWITDGNYCTQHARMHRFD